MKHEHAVFALLLITALLGLAFFGGQAIPTGAAFGNLMGYETQYMELPWHRHNCPTGFQSVWFSDPRVGSGLLQACYSSATGRYYNMVTGEMQYVAKDWRQPDIVRRGLEGYTSGFGTKYHTYGYDLNPGGTYYDRGTYRSFTPPSAFHIYGNLEGATFDRRLR